MVKKRKQRKLALSMRGGGARCAAYLGVIKALEENNIKIDYIVGSSGGAIAGGSYAATKSLEKSIDHFRNFKPKEYLSLDCLRDFTLASDDKGIEYARKLVGNMDIQDTKIKFWPQVTNLETGESELLGKGDLALATIASSAAPFLVRPVEFNGQKYIDGDISSGFAVEFLKSQGAEIVIGLQVEGEHKDNNKDSITGRILKPLDIALDHIKRLDNSLHPVDLLIDGLAKNGKLLDFHQTDFLVEEGYQKTIKVMNRIRKLIWSN